MDWKFDQAPNVACLTSRSVVDGAPALIVTHYEDDDSWAFLDGQVWDDANAMMVAMSAVVNLHPDLHDIADLPPGWSASRAAIGTPWVKERDEAGRRHVKRATLVTPADR